MKLLTLAILFLTLVAVIVFIRSDIAEDEAECELDCEEYDLEFVDFKPALGFISSECWCQEEGEPPQRIG